jgi:hypothetical protein
MSQKRKGRTKRKTPRAGKLRYALVRGRRSRNPIALFGNKARAGKLARWVRKHFGAPVRVVRTRRAK